MRRGGGGIWTGGERKGSHHHHHHQSCHRRGRQQQQHVHTEAAPNVRTEQSVHASEKGLQGRKRKGSATGRSYRRRGKRGKAAAFVEIEGWRKRRRRRASSSSLFSNLCAPLPFSPLPKLPFLLHSFIKPCIDSPHFPSETFGRSMPKH